MQCDFITCKDYNLLWCSAEKGCESAFVRECLLNKYYNCDFILIY